LQKQKKRGRQKGERISGGKFNNNRKRRELLLWKRKTGGQVSTREKKRPQPLSKGKGRPGSGGGCSGTSLISQEKELPENQRGSKRKKVPFPDEERLFPPSQGGGTVRPESSRLLSKGMGRKETLHCLLKGKKLQIQSGRKDAERRKIFFFPRPFFWKKS